MTVSSKTLPVVSLLELTNGLRLSVLKVEPLRICKTQTHPWFNHFIMGRLKVKSDDRVTTPHGNNTKTTIKLGRISSKNASLNTRIAGLVDKSLEFTHENAQVVCQFRTT